MIVISNVKNHFLGFFVKEKFRYLIQKKKGFGICFEF